MKLLLSFFIFFLITNCSKPKTVLICGNHVCLNNKEAEQFFEENLSIEVKIIDMNIKKEVDLVELNLQTSRVGKKEVKVYSKQQTNKSIKVLSGKEKTKIRKDIKAKEKEKKIAKKILNKDKKLKEKTIKKTKKIKINESSENIIIKKNDEKKNIDVVDVCTILKKCNIEEITKYLINQGRKKDFPDITLRQ